MRWTMVYEMNEMRMTKLMRWTLVHEMHEMKVTKQICNNTNKGRFFCINPDRLGRFQNGSTILPFSNLQFVFFK